MTRRRRGQSVQANATLRGGPPYHHREDLQDAATLTDAHVNKVNKTPGKALVGCSVGPNWLVEGSDVEASLIFLFLRKLASRGIEQ